MSAAIAPHYDWMVSMFGKAARSAAVGLLCLTAVLGGHAAAAAPAAPQEGTAAWVNLPDEHRIRIDDKQAFAVELCADSGTPRACRTITERCTDQFASVGAGWVKAVNRNNLRRCPQTGGLPGSALRGAMTDTVSYWNTH
ncbi:hypothetical protein [Streptomyces sp. NPDC088785]|uniref:hypothetical protein n=1 Tax=Streptomyces sp. NPDC088785 TaxID=3365897 RepID=UPI003827BB11